MNHSPVKDPKIQRLAEALKEIWKDEEEHHRIPFDRFFKNNEITEESVNSALSDYPDIEKDVILDLKCIMKSIDYEIHMENTDLKDRKDVTPTVIIEKLNRKNHPTWYYTRFEKARIVGARSLQISYGAPVLIEYPDNMLDPIDIALLEYDNDMIPITISENGSFGRRMASY